MGRWQSKRLASNDGGVFNGAGPSTLRFANGPPPHRKSMGRIRMYPPGFVILNLFQDNKQPSPVILKQVQDDDGFGLAENGFDFR